MYAYPEQKSIQALLFIIRLGQSNSNYCNCILIGVTKFTFTLYLILYLFGAQSQ